jgi:hypothetical protein
MLSFTECLQQTDHVHCSIPRALAIFPTPSSRVDAFLIKSWVCPSWSHFRASAPQSTYVESSSYFSKSPDIAWVGAQLLSIAQSSPETLICCLFVLADLVYDYSTTADACVTATSSPRAPRFAHGRPVATLPRRRRLGIRFQMPSRGTRTSGVANAAFGRRVLRSSDGHHQIRVWLCMSTSAYSRQAKAYPEVNPCCKKMLRRCVVEGGCSSLTCTRKS